MSPLAGWALRPDERGAAPPEASRETWLLLPEVGGAAPPHAPIGRALRPIPREFMQGWQPLHPPVDLPGPHPGFLSFHDERNQRRARGCAPGPCWGAIIIPPATQALLPPEKGTTLYS